MRLSSPEVSDQRQRSESPSVSAKPIRRRPTRRRFFLRRNPPPPSTTPSSGSTNPEGIGTPAASDNGNQPDSCSDFLSKSFISSSSSSALPAYINVAPLPVFCGLPGECPAAHLARFERVCCANNATTFDMVTRIFPVTLLNDAALWYDLAVEPRPDMTWDAIKSAFLKAFRRPEFADSARTELLSLQQRDDETVTSYHLRMHGILKRWPEHGLPESLVRGLFIDGLRDEFHDWVVPRRPETLEDAVGLAMDWEGAQVTRAARRRGGDEERCGFCEGRHREVECEVRRRMKEEWMRRTRGEDRKSSGLEWKEKEKEKEKAKEEEGEEQIGEERLGRVGSIGRKSVCQCWKHQCWKKYERSGSALTARNAAAAALEAAPPAASSSAAQ